jgi:hypothetical protein
MRLVTRILFGLAGFLVLAAAVYWLMTYQRFTKDPAGAALMLVGAVGFGYTALVLRAANRRAERATAAGRSASGEVAHVPPTIWPFGFSVAALALVVGLVVATKVLLPLGLVLLAVSAAGWFVEVGRAHRHARDH